MYDSLACLQVLAVMDAAPGKDPFLGHGFFVKAQVLEKEGKSSEAFAHYVKAAKAYRYCSPPLDERSFAGLQVHNGFFCRACHRPSHTTLKLQKLQMCCMRH